MCCWRCRHDCPGFHRAGGLAAPAQAAPSAPAIHYSFKTINNNNDPTFNQLLGINDAGKIAGYFGSGAKGHPNKGYTLTPPYHQVNFRNQNFPGSKQTQVTGLNNGDIQVGFYSKMNTASGNNNNFGFYSINGTHFHKVNFPTKNPASPPVDQLLGVNDSGLAVGFYVDAKGNSHGYLYDIPAHKYISENPPLGTGVTSVTPTGINDPDSVVGFFVNSQRRHPRLPGQEGRAASVHPERAWLGRHDAVRRQQVRHGRRHLHEGLEELRLHLEPQARLPDHQGPERPDPDLRQRRQLRR